MTPTAPYQKFLDILDSKSPETKRQYLKDFQYFLEFYGVKDPNLLITKELSHSLESIEEVEDRIIDYINHLKKLRMSYSTINVRLNAIQKFYIANRIKINTKHISQFKPQQTKKRQDSAYTHEDIEKLLNVANERDRVMILLLTSSGARIGSLCTLTIGNLSKVYPQGYPPNNHIYKVIVYAGDREEYYSFTTFECAQAIDAYLAYRERYGEKLSTGSPLIRNHFNTNSSSTISKIKFLRTKTFHSEIERILQRAGIRTRTKKGEEHIHKHMASHACRKFFNTQMLKAGVDYNTKEFLQGRKVSRGLDISYDRTPEKDRLAGYVKAIDLLTISPENRLRRQVQEQEHTILVQMAEKDKQIEEMMRKQERFEQLIQSLIDSGQLKPITIQ